VSEKWPANGENVEYANSRQHDKLSTVPISIAKSSEDTKVQQRIVAKY
jgi:hypothetical protein